MKSRIVICFFIIILLVGCSAKTSINKQSIGSDVSLSEKSLQNKKVEDVNDTNSDATADNDKIDAKALFLKNLESVNIDAEIIKMQVVKKNLIVIVTVSGGYDDNCIVKEDGMVKYHFYNTLTGEYNLITHDYLHNASYNNISFETHEDCIVIYSGEYVVIIDNDFHITDAFSVEECVTKRYFSVERRFCVKPSTREIFYYEISKREDVFTEVYSMDYNKSNKKELMMIDVSDKYLGKISSIFNLCVSYDEKKLFFTGNCFKELSDGESAKICYGTIDLSTMEYVSFINRKKELCLLENGALFYNDNQLNEKDNSREVVYISNDSEKKDFFVTSNLENLNVCISDGENYFATIVGGDMVKNGNMDETYISIYDMKMGEYFGGLKIDDNLSEMIYLEKFGMCIYPITDYSNELYHCQVKYIEISK